MYVINLVDNTKLPRYTPAHDAASQFHHRFVLWLTITEAMENKLRVELNENTFE